MYAGGKESGGCQKRLHGLGIIETLTSDLSSREDVGEVVNHSAEEVADSQGIDILCRQLLEQISNGTIKMSASVFLDFPAHTPSFVPSPWQGWQQRWQRSPTRGSRTHSGSQPLPSGISHL